MRPILKLLFQNFHEVLNLSIFWGWRILFFVTTNSKIKFSRYKVSSQHNLFTSASFGLPNELCCRDFVENFTKKLRTFDLSFASNETKFKNPITKNQNNFLVNTGFSVKFFQKSQNDNIIFL